LINFDFWLAKPMLAKPAQKSFLLPFLIENRLILWIFFAQSTTFDVGSAHTSSGLRHDVGSAHTSWLCHDPSEARTSSGLRPDDQKSKLMWASPTRHPGGARMMVASRPRHGKAMMWASPTCHPGFARMIKNHFQQNKKIRTWMTTTVLCAQ
jgi:hypothetical protein